MGTVASQSFQGFPATYLSLPNTASATKACSSMATEDHLTSLVQAQLSTARVSQLQWSERSIRHRLSVLRQLRLKIARDPRVLANTVIRDNQAETLAAEVLPLLDACRFLETQSDRILREKVVGTRGRPSWLWGNRLILRPEPVGVVLVIGPSNYPLMLPGIQILQAIAAGNAVLIKPAVHCSQPMRTLIDLAQASGLPAGVIQLMPEPPSAAGQAIRQGVDKVVLTGSANTGKAVSRELAESMTPSVMELSGCDAVFVLQDANLDLVSDCLLFGLTLNNSHTCMAPRRVFASNRQADEILKLLKIKIATLGPNGHAATSLHSAIAVEKILSAMKDGAILVSDCLSESNPPELNGLAILDRVTCDMSITQADIFAPVLSMIRVESEAQALCENNKCNLALSASVFGSTASCQHFARRIPANCIVINDLIVPTADPRVPFGGRQASGHGITRGEAGLLGMTQLKAIITSRSWFKPHLKQPTAADIKVLEQLIRLEHAASPLQSLKTLPNMIKASMEQWKLRQVPQGNKEAV